MNCRREFSNVTKTYLCTFYDILEDMVAKMEGAGLTNSLSNTFIDQMIPHHEGAIKMSRNLLQYTTCVPLQKIAANIVDEQTKGIENMQRIRERCGEKTNSAQDLCLYQRKFQRITQAMCLEMSNACSVNDINVNFMREMIPHHRGAIRLSENALCYPICPELLPILQSIITSQKKGIREMEHLLRCVG
ncbi:MAG: DUF305 domain-containing protein [Clostridiales bacterium]|nr:DUF305 domain-containing protein [Clostridiales bacterium]